MSKTVVVVEAPSKAKTIESYLGKKDLIVLASYGHIRDLPSKSGSVDPKTFDMTWDVSKKASKALKELEKNVANASELYLATDPDREGEAISWHVISFLKEKKVLSNKTHVKRVVFHEITPKAVKQAFSQPRDLNFELIDAYLARRALDYLFGFTLSPVLWRKLPGSRSAGRVQSVSLRLVVDREQEIESFITREYWTIDTSFESSTGSLLGRLYSKDGKTLDKFAIASKDDATTLQKEILKHTYHIKEIEKKQVKRHPSPPFMTSTLQQEASRRLGMGASMTMRVAQGLYEGINIGGEIIGLITYMRTDALTLSKDATDEIRTFIKDTFSSDYVPKAARVYKTKVKNAQEAHEAIRPTSITRTPESVAPYLDPTQLKLYELIWKRALACQMESALIDQVTIFTHSKDNTLGFRSVGRRIAFDGFLRVYEETSDEESDEHDTILPPFHVNDIVDAKDIKPEQHFTQPPPRYSEAMLVKKMEELGIGRPSTYAGILQVIQDRGYVTLEKKRFVPSDRGWIVITFLKKYFANYVAYDFTAHMEDQLDDIANGKEAWKKILSDFWKNFSELTNQAKDLKNADVIDELHKQLEPHLFKTEEEKYCPKCKEKLHLKLSKFGGFIGCTAYPTCTYTRQLDQDTSSDTLTPVNDVVNIGIDPETHEEITLRTGMYGPYFQWDPTAESLSLQEAGKKENTTEKKRGKAKKDASPQPKRLSVPALFAQMPMSLELALKLKSLPKVLGQDAEGNTVSMGIGRFGPYVKCKEIFASLPKDQTFWDTSLERACTLIKGKEKGLSKRKKGTA